MDFEDLNDIMALASGDGTVVKQGCKDYEKDGVERLLKLWKQFANIVLKSSDREKYEALDTDVPLNVIKAYLWWRLNTGKGRLNGNKITTQTLRKEFYQIARHNTRETDRTWSGKEFAHMKEFIDIHLKSRGASTLARTRAIAYAPDADEILFYLWNCSERTYASPRMMVQFSFWLHVTCIWGLRTGEFTESSTHRGSNEGVHYGDVTFSLVRRRSELIYEIKIELRNRKFNRDNASKIKTITLREETNPKERFRCPVRKFLALALADDVFVDNVTPESLDNRWVPPTAGSKVFAIKAEMKDVPVLRKMMPSGGTHPTEIWSAMSVNSMLGQVCLDAGYTEPVTAYSFRRGVANNMEATASSKSTKEALGHKGDRVWHAYAAPIISVDGQNIAYGKSEDASHARFTQSIAVTRDFGAPKPSGSQMGIGSVVYKSTLEKAKSGMRPVTDRAVHQKARKLQHILARNKYIASVGKMQASSESVSDSDAQDLGDHGFVRSPQSSAVFKQMLKYSPLHARVLETLWTAKTASLGECVKPLLGLASPKPYRAWYPNPVLSPKEDYRCPYCFKQLKGRGNFKNHRHRATHVLECYQIIHSVTFCVQCAMFVHDRLIENHMCLDLDLEQNGVYGVITWRNLVISEGRCPYGAGLFCEERRFTDPQSLKTHIDGVHLKKKAEGHQECPTEGCSVTVGSKDHLRAHLQERHYIRMCEFGFTVSE